MAVSSAQVIVTAYYQRWGDMTIVRVTGVGQYGVNKDLSRHELPINVWTDARNIRFYGDSAYQFFGHGEVYNSPSVAPQYCFSLTIGTTRYWIYHSAAKSYIVTNSGGTATHTDITHATPRTGTVNAWTHTVFGGIPVCNAGDGSKPMYWDLNLAHKFVDLTGWTATDTCKVIRSYKNFLVALNITRSGTNKPRLVAWSKSSDIGALPTTWTSSSTNDAGEVDLAEAYSPIVDGLPLRDSFIIYTQDSTHRMDYVGGDSVMRFQNIMGMSGLLTTNCAVEFDGWHFAVTGSDVIIHDGVSANSVLDNQARRDFFQSLDINNISKTFVFKNPFLNEIFIAYCSIGSSVCDKALVYNYKTKTVSYRDLPNVNHANYGSISNELIGSWSSDSDAWDSDLSSWDGPDYTPDTARVMFASSDVKLYLMDSSATFNGTIPTAYLERQGLSFDTAESIKMIKGIRPRITGNTGETITISVGWADDPNTTPTYTSSSYTIGSLKADFFVSGRYLAIKFSNGTASQWRVDSYDIEIETMGAY